MNDYKNSEYEKYDGVMQIKNILFTITLLLSCAKATTQTVESPQLLMKELNIYVSVGLTGPDAYEGNKFKEATEYFVAEKNLQGGLLGRKLKVIAQDDSGDVETAGKNAQIALSDPDHLLTIGSPYSRIALPVSKLYGKQQKLYFTAFATHPNISRSGPTVFQLAYNDEFQGIVLSDFAHTTLKTKKVLVITYRSDPYSEGLSKEFIKNIGKKPNMTIQQFDFIKGNLKSGQLANHLNSFKPDLVFVPLLRETAVEVINIVSEIKQPGVRILGSDGWGIQTQIESLLKLSLSKGKNQKYYYTFFWHPDVNTQLSKKIKNMYKQKTADQPYVAGVFAIELLSMVYDASVESGSFKADAIAKHLKSKSWQGTTGEVRFLPEETKRPIVMLEMSKTGFRLHSIIEPAQSKSTK